MSQSEEKKALLVQDDRIDGRIFACPTCYHYFCGGVVCDHCGQPLDVTKPFIKYEGDIYYDR